MSNWRVAESLQTLLGQLNALFPNRSKVSDGSIGNAEHASRNSDHNPYIKNGNMGIVTARDFTHDPANGINGQWLADALVASRDPRIKYVIWNKQICSSKQSPWVWRPYHGANAHQHHVHLSVDADPKLYDSKAPWTLSATTPQDSGTAIPAAAHTNAGSNSAIQPIESLPVLKQGATGDTVRRLQARLGIKQDGSFGPNTEKAVKAFQSEHGLRADGIVGNNTWGAMKS